MGMAASQARYLGLTARKTNVEWEGQQINQARTALANQSANLFNQLLGLKVPDCPDKTDFTKVQYSYTDGHNASVLDNWQQISDSSKDYNYIVDHYYYANMYTGSKKLMSDPQVTFKHDSSSAIQVPTISTQVRKTADGSYSYANVVYSDLAKYSSDPELQNAILDLVREGKITDPSITPDFQFTPEVTARILSQLKGYHDGNSWHFATNEELEKAASSPANLNAGYVDLTDFIKIDATGTRYIDLSDPDTLISVKNALEVAHPESIWDDNRVRGWINSADIQNSDFFKAVGHVTATFEEAYTVAPFNDMTTTYDPQFVGNAKLTELGALSAEDDTALAQIVKDLPDSSLIKQGYITINTDGSINYSGSGVYKFEWNGVTKYTTFDDLVNSMQRPLKNEKPIEAQSKLATFEASYIKNEVKETNKALLETDGNGRFRSVKFDNDSTTYILNCEEITDESAYDDAMNSYYHDIAVYEKTIADINAKTETIQQQDRTLELRLKQLDTEQNALQTEMEAVKKVISKNVEMTFKTFSGS